MEIKYKRDLNHTYLILELPLLYEEDYQMKMFQANVIEGFLPVTGQGVDGMSRYLYEISEKTSLKSMYEKAEMRQEELEKFLIQLLAAFNNAQRYMLDTNRILLKPEYIFYEEETYSFCYLPIGHRELCKEFHKLTEYFVSKIDHKQEGGILLAYGLHKATMEENYNLEKIVERLRQEGKKTICFKQQETAEELSDEDWIDYVDEEPEGIVLRESASGWKKRKKGRKRRAGKWGEWEG